MQLLVFDNSLVLLGAPGKIPQEAIPPSTPRKLRFLDPPPLGISVNLHRGGGMDIFWNYTMDHHHTFDSRVKTGVYVFT